MVLDCIFSNSVATLCSVNRRNSWQCSFPVVLTSAYFGTRRHFFQMSIIDIFGETFTYNSHFRVPNREFRLIFCMKSLVFMSYEITFMGSCEIQSYFTIVWLYDFFQPVILEKHFVEEGMDIIVALLTWMRTALLTAWYTMYSDNQQLQCVYITCQMFQNQETMKVCLFTWE